MTARSPLPEPFPTYSLRADNFSADVFYEDLALFTNEALLRLRAFEPWIAEYCAHLADRRIEAPRAPGEYMYELLALGMYWNEYGSRAIATSRFSTSLLHGLVRLRRRRPALKANIDVARGVLGGMLLHREARNGAAPVPSLLNLRSLIRWLRATGDFREESLRLERWVHFLGTLSGGEAALVLLEAVRVASWFDEAALQALGAYTAGVEDFIDHSQRQYRFREDRVFCGRGRAEYHLSMVGAEIMNRAFRGEFLLAPRRLVGVPGCMRALPKDACKAFADAKGDVRCADCTARCRVRHLSLFCRERNADVVIIPHSSDFSRWAERKGREGKDGVVGVACVPALIEGGLELRANGVPAQCVFLNFSGCKGHWTGNGVATEIHTEQLAKILGDRNDRRIEATDANAGAEAQLEDAALEVMA